MDLRALAGELAEVFEATHGRAVRLALPAEPKGLCAAAPTEQVRAILTVTGDCQKFKGLPGAEGTLRVAAPKVDKKAVFEAAAKESIGEAKEGATTPKARKGARKAAEPATQAAAADEGAPAAAAAEAPAADAEG